MHVCRFSGLDVHLGRVSSVYSLLLNCLEGNISESELKQDSSVLGRVVYHHLE